MLHCFYSYTKLELNQKKSGEINAIKFEPVLRFRTNLKTKLPRFYLQL